MTDKPTVYLAGPIQHAADRGKGWRARVKERPTFDWMDPMDKYDSTDDEGMEWSDTDIVEDDLEIIDGCDALLVHWEEVPTCGTPMEIRYAHERDIPIVVQTKVPRERLSPWLTYHADAIETTFNGAVRVLLETLQK